MTMIVMDSNQPYTEFITQSLDELSKHSVNGIALVALVDDSYELTSYWNMTLRNKLQAENALRFDSMDEFILANRERYLEEDT